MPSQSFYFKGHTYKIDLDAQTWNQAAQTAKNSGGYLARITSAEENTAVFNFAKSHYNSASSHFIAQDGGGGSYVWIGGTDAAIEGRWAWSNGTAISGYTNWGAGNGVTEPDNFQGAQDHLGLSLDGWPHPSSAIGAAGEWNDISGSNGLWSIIEWDGLQGTARNDKITGSVLAESLFGKGGNDSLRGGGGGDKIMGGSGADSLYGDAGSDTLSGDGGTDVMTGGASRDVFKFDDGHSAKGSARDRITDFTTGVDDLDLRLIDANSAASGDQAFIFSGGIAKANAVWAVAQTGNTIIRGDVSGDGVFDFEVLLNGVQAVARGDFLL